MSEERRTKTKVYLKIHDFDCAVDEITTLIGINPSQAWQEGDLIPGRNTDMRRKFSSWILASNADAHASIEEHVEALVNIISPRLKVFKDLISIYRGELTIVVYAYNEYNVGGYVNKDKLRVLLDLGVSLDIDIYFLNHAESKMNDLP
ncbi:DUF4279 domain-containing protein [Chitinophaga vietnamensis]|uniref:DUF4279 domain-containing protein n=1 Tax=Chitinophaga vietnamensis TaxID=2593957 RepID=UPI001178C7AC|nr:DUF4279 domain-containing protein [Chitinophaga vietnamensis]